MNNTNNNSNTPVNPFAGANVAQDAAPVQPTAQPAAPFGSPDTANTINWSIAEAEFVELTDGDYKARVVGVEETVSQAGNPMIVLTMALTEGTSAGKEFKTYLVRTSAALWKLKEALHALKIPSANGVYQISTDVLMNKECIIKLVTEVDPNGEYPDRQNIKKMLPLK